MKRQRLLILALSLAMLLSMLPVGAAAAEITAQGTCGDGVNWVLGANGSLAFSGSGNMPDYVPDPVTGLPNTPWHAYGDQIIEIWIDGDIGIGAYAFQGLKNLKSVQLPENANIGSHAFENCTALEMVFDYSALSIGAYAFAGCDKITNTGVWKGTEQVGEKAFFGCKGITQLEVHPALTKWGAKAFAESGLEELTVNSGATLGSKAFDSCTSLSKAYLIGNVKNLDKENNAFSGCAGLTIYAHKGMPAEALAKELGVPFVSSGHVVVPNSTPENWDGERCKYCNIICGTNAGNVIWYLEDGTLIISGKGTVNSNYKKWEKYTEQITELIVEEGITGWFGWFDNYPNLKRVEIAGTVSEINTGAFSDCAALTEVVLHEGILCIGSSAFARCTALEEIKIPASVDTWGGAPFNGCTKLNKIEIAAGSKYYINDSNGVVYTADMATLVDVPKTLSGSYRIHDGVTQIRWGAFMSCGKLTGVTVPEGIERLDSSTFRNCTSLKTVSLPESLKSICMEAFRGCAALGTLKVPAGVKTFEFDVLDECTSLKNVVFEGNAPQFSYLAFEDQSFTCWYPMGDTTWTEKIKEYVSGNITWKEGVPEVSQEVARIYGATRYATAFEAADTLKAQLGVEKFDAIVVADGTNFADALSGSYLASVKNAPILLVRDRKQEMEQVKVYIKENLVSGGTVYLLGGVNAVPKAMESGLDGFRVKRLGGSNRYETNLLILKEAGVGDKDILICTGKGFADSLSASAAKLPILLVKDSLTDSQKNFLKGTKGKKYIIGGTAAVNTKVESALKAYGTVVRLGGNTRYETSVLVAKTFFEKPTAIVLAYAQNFPDGLSGGALAAGMDAPLILTVNGKEKAAADYAKSLGIQDGYILGGITLISDKTVKNIFGVEPITVK